jgi:phage protein D
MAATTDRIAPARPTITTRGQAQPGLAEGLLELRIRETVDGLSSCEAAFGNRGPQGGKLSYLYFDRKLLDFGVPITFAVAGRPLFDGVVTGLEAGFGEGEAARLTVLAEDRYQDLRMVRRTRTFTDVTDADLLRRVAGEHGLTADVSLPGPTHRFVAQLNQSDLAFLRERARAVEAELSMEGKQLRARPRSARTGTPVVLGYGNELRAFTAVADLAGQRTSLTVSGWDVTAKRALAETVGPPVVAGELRGGQGGPALLQQAFGARPESVVATVPFDAAEARARAETLFRRMARRFVVGRGTAEARLGLRVGTTVRLEHVGDLFSGEYYVSEVEHLFDGRDGLRTDFVVERPGLGSAAA